MNDEIARLSQTNRQYVSLARRILADADKHPEYARQLRAGQRSISSIRFKLEANGREKSRSDFLRSKVRYANPVGLENEIICCDVIEGLRKLPDDSVTLVFTSIPYNVQSNYGLDRNGNKIEDNRPWGEYLS